jgi:tellurite resistance protein TerC
MIWIWIAFIGFVLLMLALDLGVFHREAHVVAAKEALAWSAGWITLALLFSVFIYFAYEGQWFGLGTQIDALDGEINDGTSATVKYLTGYIVEESLSIDNLFVIALIFKFFAVPALYQHRVLFWGILGALVMRGTMIGIGAKLVTEFHWIIYVFGVFLIGTGIRMLFISSEEDDFNNNFLVRLARRFLPITSRFHGEHFLVRAGSAASHEAELPDQVELRDPVVENAKVGTLLLTPLALALIVIETTDLIFAVDSIPAIFAITADPFLVFTSNVFAILGLRSLYFALADLLDRFQYLKVSLAIILMLVGVKMLAADWFKELLGKSFNFYLLGMVVLILGGGVVASILKGTHHKERPGG